MSVIKKITLFLLIVLALIVGAFVVLDNPETVTFRFLGFAISSLPLGLWALLVFLAGLLLGLLASLLPAKKRRS